MSSPQQHMRQQSEASRLPHSVSLKVLRLSKPQLSYQFPLPAQTSDLLPRIDPRAALSHAAAADPANESILSPVLTLPPSFGTVYVGETFSCTLCANNELSPKSNPVSINGVRISAVMQTPSSSEGVALRLFSSHALAKEAEGETSDQAPPASPPLTLDLGETLARIVRFDLREEGQHVLAVTVTYTESYPQAPLGDDAATDALPITRGRVRTFRKLYQFMAHQLLSVRTKAQMLPPQVNKPHEFVLEAQLENLGDGAVMLDTLNMSAANGLHVRGLNAWDFDELKGKDQRSVSLDAKHILQSCFLFRTSDEADVKQLTQDGRIVLGQLSIDWRGVMGEKGSLSTGNLAAKRKY